MKLKKLDSHFRENDGMQVSVRMDSSFPRRRESRSVGAETYRIKRFLQILRSGFPLSWE
ncbi:pilus assembly protein PilS [Neisseria meningitidis]|nr:pilus assembly protein PilS [Neisseria meningitidis]RQJ68926.1 pilus assembly protein PilS [Neisseria meningitidis]